MAAVTKLSIKFQTGSGNTVFATWAFSKTHVNYYRVNWYYDTGNGVWFDGGSSDVKVKQATYSYPSNAVNVKVTVKPVSTKRKKKGKMRPYWTGTAKSLTWSIGGAQPATPSAPQVSIDKLKLTAYLDIEDTAIDDRVEFYTVKTYTDSEGALKSVKYNNVVKTISAGRSTHEFNVTAGATYKVKCRVQNLSGTGAVIQTSEWSPYSSDVKTIPSAVSEIVECYATSKNSVYFKWIPVQSAESYKVEYTYRKDFFNSNPSAIQSTTTETDHAEITGIDTSGGRNQWFFRVKAVNKQGESGFFPHWADIKGVKLGVKPQPPTTWTISTNVKMGEQVMLYWTHNSEDGSKQSNAKIEIKVGNIIEEIDYVTAMNNLGLDIPKADENEVEKPYYFPIDTNNYNDNDELIWRVRTKGAINEYSDWSIDRSIKINESPNLSVILGDNIVDEDELMTGYPYKITLSSSPTTQTPIMYHISIVSNESYTTEDDLGQSVHISEGTEIFSKLIVSSDHNQIMELLPNMVTLEDGLSYTIKSIVTMDSGLIAEDSSSFTVELEDFDCEIEGSIFIDMENLTAIIDPSCYHAVDEDIDEPTERVLMENVLLSVYRREYDGSFTEIEADVVNDVVGDVLDPHPPLDYARYRIIAQDQNTGKIAYEDLSPEYIGEPSIVIQWGESLIGYDDSEEMEDPLAIPTWTGTMVKLPYNVKVSEKKSLDVSLVKYVGRSHPVGYYGTHKNEGGVWSTVIPTSDTETLYLLRLLSNWPGDVYVREPSGVGYWANITVDISQEFKELTTPITFNVTRVEGGK